MKNPRRDAQATSVASSSSNTHGRQPGEPIRPTLLSVVVRSVLAIAVFLIITTATGNKFSQVAVIAGVLFVFMVGFGYMFDKWFYTVRMKRWIAKRGGKA